MITPQDRLNIKNEFIGLTSPHDLAKFLGITLKQLTYYSIILPEEKKYKVFSIPKKNGDERLINAPITTLKYIQRQLANKLQVLYEPLNTAHGFIKEYEDKNQRKIKPSIVTNADQHKRKGIILNLDLKDFFPTITKKRVFGLFKNQYSINSRIAYYLTNICCTENGLPQGAPTSPIITNMICSRLDRKLRRLSANNYVTYSRYADDLSFSTSRKKFSENLESDIRKILEGEGFFLNERKRRLHIRENRMEVTGLTVNIKPNVQRKYVRNLRAIFHNIETKGLLFAANDYNSLNDKANNSDSKKIKNYLKGKIEYLGQVRGKDDNIYLKFRDKFTEVFNVNKKIVMEVKEETSDFIDKRDKLLEKYNSEIVAAIQDDTEEKKNLKNRIQKKLDKARKILLSPDKHNYYETLYIHWFSCLNEFEKMHFIIKEIIDEISLDGNKIVNNKTEGKKKNNKEKKYKIDLDGNEIVNNDYTYEYFLTLPSYKNVGCNKKKQKNNQDGFPKPKLSFLIQLFLIEKRNGSYVYEFAWLNEIRNRLNLTHSDEINLKRSKYFERVGWEQCSWMFQFLYYIFTSKQIAWDSVFQENPYINNHTEEGNMKITGTVEKISKLYNCHDLFINFGNNNSPRPQSMKIRIWQTYNDKTNEKMKAEKERIFNDYLSKNINIGDTVRVVVEFHLNKGKKEEEGKENEYEYKYNNIYLLDIEKLPEPKFLAK